MSVTVKISARPISVQSVLRSVASKEAGGTAIFVGTVRSSSNDMKKVSSMEVEAEGDMAKRDLERIAAEAVDKFGALGVAVSHRVGHLSVGDIIIVIAVSAAHRKEAFRSCEYVIDRLKKTTPIWKKEYWGKKAQWATSEG